MYDGLKKGIYKAYTKVIQRSYKYNGNSPRMRFLGEFPCRFCDSLLGCRLQKSRTKTLRLIEWFEVNQPPDGTPALKIGNDGNSPCFVFGKTHNKMAETHHFSWETQHFSWETRYFKGHGSSAIRPPCLLLQVASSKIQMQSDAIQPHIQEPGGTMAQ